MKLYETKADILAAINSIANRGKKLDSDIQRAAVSAMAHHSQHGDVTLINTLVEAMPKGSRVNALRDYLLTFGKVQWDDENKALIHDREGEFNLEGALGMNWTEFKPEPAYKPFDADVALKQLLKRVNSADADKGDRVTPEQAQAIRSACKAVGVEA